MSNLDEVIAGTDPKNANSRLHLAASRAGAGVLLNFAAVSNKTYTVQCCTNLDALSWQRLTNVAAAPTNRTFVITNAPAGANRRYYRLATPQLP